MVNAAVQRHFAGSIPALAANNFYMKSEDKHSWTFVKSDKYTKEYNCSICNCNKVVITENSFAYVLYTREKMHYDYRPDCFGPVPINEQGID